MSTTLRVATYNASLNRSSQGELISDLSTADDTQAQEIAQVIQTERPDIVLINEFDYDAAGEAAALFQTNYLGVSQNGEPVIDYPYVYVAPSNTGVATGLDLDNDGGTSGPGDAQGFGFFEGQFGFIILSQYPIVEDEIRSFQTFLWKDMPDSQLTDTSDGSQALYDPETPEAGYYTQEEIDTLRLSSKNHVDLPVDVNGEIVHILAAHPTPPVFDGAEDRNGKRNHDEIRFWADYVEGADYIYDDTGAYGGLETGERFVIVGDYNADPFDGDSRDQAAQQLLDHEMITGSATDAAITPQGLGSLDQPGGDNASHLGDPAFDTADFGFNGADPSSDNAPGNLRVDYALPSAYGFDYLDGAVVWPADADPYADITNFPTSDHRMVWVDLELISTETVTAGLSPIWAQDITGTKYQLDVQSGAAAAWGRAQFALQGFGDFDGDGEIDTLTRNATTGVFKTFFADGTARLLGSPLNSFVATLDVNGDGTDEVLMRRANGKYVIQDGVTGANIGGLQRANLDVIATADVNGDGNDDAIGLNGVGRLAWTDLTTGELTLYGTGTAVEALGIADVDGNGTEELIVQRANGNKVALDADGVAVATFGQAEATLVATGDFLADAGDELVFEQAGNFIIVDGASGATLATVDAGLADALSFAGTYRGDTGYLDQLIFTATTGTETRTFALNAQTDTQTDLDLSGKTLITENATGLAPLSSSPFQYGVASGDPAADSVVLWTHARPANTTDADEVTVEWEIATDAEFANVITSGTGTTDADKDFTFKTVADGLVPGGEYFYRFKVNGAYSDIGQTRTLPEADVSQVDFAIFSCVNYPAGYFNAYEAAVENGFDYSIHLGDYIYEYGIGGYATEDAEALGRLPSPENEIVSLDDYLGRYAQYTTDADLQALRAAAPMIMMWDDHETANDSWETGAQNHNPDDPDAPEFGVTWEERTDAALEAYYLWNPLREPDTDLRDADKTYEFGDLVDLHMLETRLQARDVTRADLFSAIGYKMEVYAGEDTTELLADAALAGVDEATLNDVLTNGTPEEQDELLTGIALVGLVAEAQDPDREMIGTEQLTDLVGKIETSDATWQIIGSQTLMGRMELPAEVMLNLVSYAGLFIKSALGILTAEDIALLDSLDDVNEVPYNFDSWDGYQAEREAIFEALGASASGGIVISGDTHNAWMNNLRTEDGTLVGVEFATPGVTSPGLEDFLPAINNPITGEQLDLLSDTFVRFVDDLVYANILDRGYIDLEVTATEVNSNYVYVSTTASKDFDTEVVTQTATLDQFEILV